jgi:hypothetical protein
VTQLSFLQTPIISRKSSPALGSSNRISYPDIYGVPTLKVGDIGCIAINMLTLAKSHRWLDPCLGIFTGCLAYYLYETHPRTVRAPGDRLADLVKWKMGQMEERRRVESGGVDASEERKTTWTRSMIDDGEESPGRQDSRWCRSS